MKISLICPVFNERKNLENLTLVLKKTDFLDEIIFVDDGSTDGSFEFLKNLGGKIKVFRFRENKGKGQALSYGIERASGEILVFIDSDLIGLRRDHLKSLVLPLLKKKKVVIGVPLEKKRKIIRPWEVYLSGERSYFKDDLLPHLEKISKLRYGVEFFLNSLFDFDDIKIIPLIGLVSPSKFEKRSFNEAVKEYLKEIKEIFEDLKTFNFKPLLARGILKSYIKEMMGVWLSGRAHP